MVLSLLYGKKYQKGKIGSVELDVTLREEHKYSSKVTTFPIEEGSTLSDHIINLPTVLILEGVVTDSPLTIFPSFNRSISAFNTLISLHRQRLPITVVTGLKRYENMVITNLDIPRTVETGQSLTFIVEMQQIILDTSVRFTQNDQNIFGGVQSKIPRDIVSTGQDIPLIQFDPVNSLKDQAQSGTDFGIQVTQPIPNNTLPKVLESLAIIETYV